MNNGLEKIQKKLDDALKENKRLEVELERVKLELKLERSESAKERAKLMLETRKIQHETGMRKGKRIKTHSRAGKVRVEGRMRLCEKNPALAKRVIELHLEGYNRNSISKIVNRDGFRNLKDRIIYHSQVSTIIRDWKKGVFKTNIKPDLGHQLPKEMFKKASATLDRDKDNQNMIRALTKSTGRLKEIVEMRIKQELTLAEIGAHFSISRQRVRQILEKVRNGDYNKG
ncbi:MAG: hypothetical protein CL661_12280 [Bacteroidetes bacterium]|nr:hypothetical protein [Bacteroidota bacterium]